MFTDPRNMGTKAEVFRSEEIEISTFKLIFLILQKYEDQIESLQKQVMEQSMTMSMYSSITPDEYHPEEDVFGLWKKKLFS
jgi:hypothetical protein